MRTLCQAAAGYKKVLEENRKLYNQVQDLKGSIRVYCRIRPPLPGQENHPTSIDYTDEETVTVITPAKSGREGRKASMFNKVFGPSSTQGHFFYPFILSMNLKNLRLSFPFYVYVYRRSILRHPTIDTFCS